MAAMAAGAQGALEVSRPEFSRRSTFKRSSLSCGDFDVQANPMKVAKDPPATAWPKPLQSEETRPFDRSKPVQKQNLKLSESLEVKINELHEFALVETRSLEERIDSLQNECMRLRGIIKAGGVLKGGDLDKICPPSQSERKSRDLRVSVTSYASSMGSLASSQAVSPKEEMTKMPSIPDYPSPTDSICDSENTTPRPPCQPRKSPQLRTGMSKSMNEPEESPAQPVIAGFFHGAFAEQSEQNLSKEAGGKEAVNSKGLKQWQADHSYGTASPDALAQLSSSQENIVTQTHQPFRLWAIWSDDEFRCMPSQRTQSLHDVALDDAKFFRMVQQGHKVKTNYRWIISPTSRFNFAWDMLFILLISYDFVVVPLAVFDPEETGFTLAMSWVTRLYWTLSIPISTRTAFINEEGSVENRPSRILRHYAGTWMIFDILVVFVDWVAVAMSSLDMVGSVRFVRTTRILRAVRVLRLARLFKLPAVLESLQTRTYFEKARLLIGIAKISICIMGIAHCTACFWYAVGVSGWVEKHFDDVSSTPLSTRYAVSLHWAMTQFIGNIDIYAVTERERVFSICVLTFCFFASAAFVSQFTASLTRLSIISGSQARQFAMLRRFLDYKHISTPLSIRVTQSARHVLSQLDKYMNEKDVELLSKISQPLLQEIHYEVNVVVLTSHPFFRRYHHWNAVAVRKLCHFAAVTASLAMGDILFTEGEHPTRPKMFFLCHGLGFYIKYKVKEPATFNEGTWACEMCLWVPWVHRGTMRSATNCTILGMDVDTFHKTALEFHGPVFHPALYARIVCEHLNSAGECMANSNAVNAVRSMPSKDSGGEDQEVDDDYAEDQEGEVEEEPDANGIDDLHYGTLEIEKIVQAVFPHHLSKKDKSSDHSIGSLLRRMSISTPGTNESQEPEFAITGSAPMIDALPHSK